MSEIVITTDFSKIPKNISKIKGSNLQTTGEKFSRKTDKFGDYLNKASKYSLDDDIGSIDKNSKNLLFSENIKSKAENNTDKTQNLSDDTDNKVDKTKSVSAKEQLIDNIVQELQKLIYLQNENNSTTLQKSDKNSIKSDGINSALNKLNYLLSDKVYTKTDLAQQTSDNQGELSGMVEKQSSKETSAIEEILSELKSFDNSNDISSKSFDLTNSNAENINDDLLNNSIESNGINSVLNKLNYLLSDKVDTKTDLAQQVSNNQDKLSGILGKQSSKETSFIEEILSELKNFGNSNDISSKSSDLPNSNAENINDDLLNNSIESNGINSVLNKLNYLLSDKVDTKTDLAQQVSNNQDKLSGILGKQSSKETSFIEEILSELKNFGNSNDISSKSSDLPNSNAENINDDLLNNLISTKLSSQNFSNDSDNKVDKTQKFSNNAIDKTNRVSTKDQLINNIEQKLQKLISLQNENNNTTLPKSNKNSIKSDDINSVLNKLNYLLSDKVDTKTDLAQQVSNNQDKLSYILGKQSTKETSATEKILSELKSFDNILDSQNFANNINNKADITQNVSDNIDNKLDKTNVVSAKEQLINDIEQKLQKLISLQNDNNNTTLSKSNKNSIKSDDINSLITKISYFLSDKANTKVNKQDKLSDILGNQSSKEINDIKEILSEFKSLESSNEIISEKNSLSSAAKSVSNNQKQVLNKREVTILHNILSKLQDMYSDTNNSSTKLISTSNSLTKSKDNEFLNKLVDNKASDDKYSKIINVMNQFTVNTADLNNQNQDIQPQVINKDNFTSDFIKSLNYMEDNNIKSMTVKIAPKELGEMLIKITSDGNIMKATITATNKDSYNLLNSNLHEINNSLNNQHIKIQSLDINIYNGDTTYFSDNSNFNNNQFSGSNENQNKSSDKSTTNLNNSNSEQLDINSQISAKEDNNVNVLV